MRRTKEDAATTREQLLHAALITFSAKGYSATTLDHIAQQAGTTRGAIAWHFGNKAELFNTLVRESYQKATLHFGTLNMVGGTPLQILRQTMSRWLSYAEEDAEFRAILEITLFKTEILPEMANGIQEKNQGTQASLKYFADLIQEGIASAEVRSDINVEVAAIAAMSLINGTTTLWLMNPAAFSLKAITEETIDLFIRSIATT